MYPIDKTNLHKCSYSHKAYSMFPQALNLNWFTWNSKFYQVSTVCPQREDNSLQLAGLASNKPYSTNKSSTEWGWLYIPWNQSLHSSHWNMNPEGPFLQRQYLISPLSSCLCFSMFLALRALIDSTSASSECLNDSTIWAGSRYCCT